jgi:hypothetical protein
MPDEFQYGTDWQQSSGPLVMRKATEPLIWPIDDNSISGAKDVLADGLHPVIAVGDRAAAERALQPTGVVVTYNANATQAEVNFADGFIVRQWINSTLTYVDAAPATFETTPYQGQPVYVDDSAALSAGVTLSFSPLNSAGTRNPMAGVLWWCQDEYPDSGVGGPNATDQFDVVLPDEETEQEYCVMLFNGMRDAS